MPQAQPADLTEDTTEAPEAVGSGMGQPGGYASSCDEEEDGQVSKAVQELQEEVCHLHDQVWPVHLCPCRLSACNVIYVSQIALPAHTSKVQP